MIIIDFGGCNVTCVDLILFQNEFSSLTSHFLNHKTNRFPFSQVVAISDDIKEWPSKLCLKPSSESLTNRMICILSNIRDVRTEVQSGKLIVYDIMNECIVEEDTQHCFSSEVLQFSQDGRIIMASCKLPCEVYFLDSTSLHQLQCFSYSDFLPFLELPFKLPDKVEYLLDSEVLTNIPVSKVVSNSRGLRGLTLIESEIYFLRPMVSIDSKYYAVVVFNLGDTRAKSRVQIEGIND